MLSVKLQVVLQICWKIKNCEHEIMTFYVILI